MLTDINLPLSKPTAIDHVMLENQAAILFLFFIRRHHSFLYLSYTQLHSLLLKPPESVLHYVNLFLLPPNPTSNFDFDLSSCWSAVALKLLRTSANFYVCHPFSTSNLFSTYT